MWRKVGSEMGSRKIKRQKGTRTRTIKLDSESMEMMYQQLRAFREKFGREAGPGDPVFFDPDSDTPQPFPLERYLEESTAAMVAAGIRPEIFYAHGKTGGLPRNRIKESSLLRTSQNGKLLSTSTWKN
jgi:hypothetical protein